MAHLVSWLSRASELTDKCNLCSVVLSGSGSLGLGSNGSLTPPPPVGAVGGPGINIFNARFAAGAHGAHDRNFGGGGGGGGGAAGGLRNGGLNIFGASNQALFAHNGSKQRHNSIDKGAANRSRLLEDFR